MLVMKKIRERVKGISEGKIITLQSFSKSLSKQAVVLGLSRLYQEGVLAKLEKGKYYRPKKSIFGLIGPSEDEIVNTLLDEMKGDAYVSGGAIFNKMGLTTQISNEIVVVGGKYNRKKKIGNLNVRYQRSTFKIIKKYIKFYQILDALKEVKKIPGSDVSSNLLILKKMILGLSRDDQKKLSEISFYYKPMVRALLGAILEETKIDSIQKIKKSLNILTNYIIKFDSSILPNKKNWNIL